MNIECKLKSYDKLDETRDEALVVSSHWNSSHLVVLTIGDQKVTVNASQLTKSVENCTNK